MTESDELHASMILGAFCEGLVGRGRVALLGDGTTGLARRLAEATGRRVHVFDPDRERVAAWFGRGQPDSAHVSYAPFELDLDVRSGAFDVALVSDLTAFEDPAAALDGAKALVGQTGMAVVASPNPAVEASQATLAAAEPSRAPGYLELYDLCHERFPAIKVLGQAPFAGIAFADFSAREPAVTIDTSLCTETEDPSWFVLVGSERAAAVDPYTLVQVPVHAPAVSAGGPDLTELATARLRITVLESEIERVRDREREQERLAESRLGALNAESTRSSELEAEVTRLGARVRDDERTRDEERASAALDAARMLEAQLIERDAAISELRGRIERERTSVAARGEDLVKARARVAELEQALAGERRRLASLEGELVDERQRASGAEQALRAERARGSGLDAELAKRAERIAELEQTARPVAAEPQGPTPSERALTQRAPALAERDAGLSIARDKHLQKLLENVSVVTRERDEARAEASRLEDQLAEAEQAREIAETRATEIVERLSASDASETHLAEVDAFESALKERGALVVELRRQLLEAERFGRELIADLESARKAAALEGRRSPDAVPSAPRGAGRETDEDTDQASWPAWLAPRSTRAPQTEAAAGQEAEAASHKCARLEADLLAARWKISALEAELVDVRETDGVPLVDKLEAALRAARDELAALREAAPDERA